MNVMGKSPFDHYKKRDVPVVVHGGAGARDLGIEITDEKGEIWSGLEY